MISFAKTTAAPLEGAVLKASEDPRWLRIYQYRGSHGNYVSDIESTQFFISPEGSHSPYLEMQAALEAFQDTSAVEKKYGTLKMPAACAFPARRQILAKLLDIELPSATCPQLKDWLGTLQADRASLVFVGAYAGNAASILGHTFLRLSNSQRENSHREGVDLLSYAVGYTAHSAPDDGRLSYMVKGLTGQYPGFYDIEPYYMKVGLYNNAESRDLWELQLKMTPAETRLLSELIWEYTFNAQIPYYFVGRNCSYRLLTLLEAALPKAHLTENFKGIVLPAETARILIDQNLTEPSPRFRSSIHRRLREKIQQLSDESQNNFKPATRSVAAVKKVQDPNLLDALNDYWLYENYRVQTALPAEKKAIMEATLNHTASLPEVSSLNITSEAILDKEKLSPPFLGHRPHSVELGGGSYLALKARWGLHPSWLYEDSYADISAIEYLGLDLTKQNDASDIRWNALLIQTETLEDVWQNILTELKPSWGFRVAFGNDCFLCHLQTSEQQEVLQLSASLGISQSWHTWKFSILPEVMTTASAQEFLWMPGVKLSAKWGFALWSLYLQQSYYSGNSVKNHFNVLELFEAKIAYHLRKNTYLTADFKNSKMTGNQSLPTQNSSGVNILYFF